MAKIIDIKPQRAKPGPSSALFYRSKAAGGGIDIATSKAWAERKAAADQIKDIKRQLRNAEARQKRAAMKRASNPAPSAAGSAGGGAQVSRSATTVQAPRAAAVNAGNMSGSTTQRRRA